MISNNLKEIAYDMRGKKHSEQDLKAAGVTREFLREHMYQNPSAVDLTDPNVLADIAKIYALARRRNGVLLEQALHKRATIRDLNREAEYLIGLGHTGLQEAIFSEEVKDLFTLGTFGLGSNFPGNGGARI